jgi:ABC-2 type transport system permease protein
MIVTFFMFSIFGFMNRNGEDSSFYIGFVFWFLLSTVLSEASVSISTEKQLGTLEQLLLKPINIQTLILIVTNHIIPDFIAKLFQQ